MRTKSKNDEILLTAWKAVQKARARNRGVPERELRKLVSAAVRRVRAKSLAKS